MIRKKNLNENRKLGKLHTIILSVQLAFLVDSHLTDFSLISKNKSENLIIHLFSLLKRSKWITLCRISGICFKNRIMGL